MLRKSLKNVFGKEIESKIKPHRYLNPRGGNLVIEDEPYVISSDDLRKKPQKRFRTNDDMEKDVSKTEAPEPPLKRQDSFVSRVMAERRKPIQTINLPSK